MLCSNHLDIAWCTICLMFLPAADTCGGHLRIELTIKHYRCADR